MVRPINQSLEPEKVLKEIVKMWEYYKEINWAENCKGS
jgi:hypothetical protein